MIDGLWPVGVADAADGALVQQEGGSSGDCSDVARSGLRERLLVRDASEHVLRRFDDEVPQGEDRRHADSADHRASEGEHDVAIQHAESDHDDAE